jgi:hypothetical protein
MEWKLSMLRSIERRCQGVQYDMGGQAIDVLTVMTQAASCSNGSVQQVCTGFVRARVSWARL